MVDSRSDVMRGLGGFVRSSCRRRFTPAGRMRISRTRELMQRMGHSTVRAAMIYQHATEARSRQLADRLDALVRAQRATEEGEPGGP